MESPASALVRSRYIEAALRALGTTLLLGAAVVVVLFMRIGPVVLTLAPGRGIHSGDSLGLLGAAAAALMLAPLARRTRGTPELAGVVSGFRG